MLPPAPVTRPAATTLVAPVTRNLEATAARYAVAPAEMAECELTMLTERAIGAWRLEEAAFWQRVKFRARMLRARARGSETGSPA
jgi:hypothetical protein